MPSLYDLPLWLIAVVCVAASVTFAIAGVLTARRLGWTLDECDHTTAGIVHAFVGVLYAVALGLLVVSVQGSFDDVENASVHEASAAGDLYRTLEGLSDTSRKQIQRDVAKYVDLVIDAEWPATQKGKESDTTWRHVDHLYAEIIAYTPRGEKDLRLYQQLITDGQELLDARRTRLFLGNDGIDATTWIVVLAGAVITIGFACFFRMQKLKIQLVLTSLAAAMFGLMIFLIVAMDYPLRGEFSVEPNAFVRQRAVLRRVESEATVQTTSVREAAR